MINNLLAFVICFGVGLAISPFILKLTKKLKAGQNILEYVEEHKVKQGTPTMGGFIFIISCFIVSIFFLKKDSTLALISLVVMLAYGALGFLDDFIKVKFKQNLGLRAYQKIIGQVGIAAIIAVFAYNSGLVSSEVFVPFTANTIDLGIFIIPFIVFVYLALVNSVNLIDGLDGLCGGVSFVNFISFGFLIIMYSQTLNGKLIVEQNYLTLICFAVAGAILAFLVLNVYPAKIFMGDTGSLALGGLLASISIFARLELYILIFGIAYVITALSDVLQVIHFKRTKKRIFLMAPLHHHFQKKGMNENKIVFVYIVITAVVCITTLLICLAEGISNAI